MKEEYHIRILSHTSIETVEEVCKETGKELALWLSKNYPCEYANLIPDTTIKKMPEDFQDWFVKNKFIKKIIMKPALDPHDIYWDAFTSTLIWNKERGLRRGGEQTGTIILQIQNGKLTLVKDIPTNSPFELTSIGEILIDHNDYISNEQE